MSRRPPSTKRPMPGDPLLARPSAESVLPTRGRRDAADRCVHAVAGRGRGLSLRLGLKPGFGLAAAGAAAAGGGDRGGARRGCRLAGVADRRLAGEEVADLVAGEGLVFEEPLRQRLKVGALRLEDAARLDEAVLDEAADLGIDLLRRRLGHRLGAAHRHAEEDLLLVLAIGDGAELRREAPAGHHHAGKARRLVDVALRARGDLVGAEGHVLGDAAAHHDGEPRGHLLERHRQLVALRQLHDHAERPPARDDRRLVDGVGRRHVQRHDRLPRLAASSAASLTRFMRSAPEKPGVPRAMTRRSTSGASGTLRTCTFRIFSRPTTSGFGTTIWRSKRPGRRSAGSSTSGRFVAAMMMMPSFASKPSISTRSWFSVCSRSSLPPPRPAPRWRPTASISSMKMMQGAFFFAWSNMSRTREAPTPTNISTKSEPEIVKNGTFASPATARAISVLPVPGGPTRRQPRGMRPPRRWNFCGSRRNSTISCRSSFASSTPATSSKVTRPCASVRSFAFDLPKPMARPAPDCIWRDRNTQAPMKTRIGSQLTSSAMNHGVLSDGGRALICTPFWASFCTSMGSFGA